MEQVRNLHPLWNQFTYFEHQTDGIQWMLEKEKIGTIVDNKDNTMKINIKGGLQCDDMGLGKTIQMVSVIINHNLKDTLLVAPLAMIDVWTDVCLQAGIVVYHIDNPTKWKRIPPSNKSIPRYFCKQRPSIYITNYDKLFRSYPVIHRPYDRIVLDEAHVIRNAESMVSIYSRKLIAPIKWVLTGTPLINSLKDIVSLLSFIGVPCSATWRWEPRFMKVLPQILLHRSLDSLRKTIQNAPPIPEIHDRILPFTTTEEEEFYTGIQGMNSNLLDKYSGDLLSSKEAFILLLRLRQISVHPQIYINAKRRENISYKKKDWLMPSTKLDGIKQVIIEDLEEMEDNHKYIIFCQFYDEMEIISEFLETEELVDPTNILMYNGSLNQQQRKDILKRSKEITERSVMLIQLQSGGVGLNLQEYDRIIFISPYWTSALMDQAIARSVRIGQINIVKVFHLRLKVEVECIINIDEFINEKAQEKRVMLENLFARCAEESEQNIIPEHNITLEQNITLE